MNAGKKNDMIVAHIPPKRSTIFLMSWKNAPNKAVKTIKGIVNAKFLNE